MALEKMNVTFGGLCMLVQRTRPANKAGLYVLMPKVDHHGHKHCPLVVCGKDFGGNNTARWEHLNENDDINLSALTTGTKRVIDEVANVSVFDGGRKVDPRCMDSTHPHLAARVVLPLPPATGGIVSVGRGGRFKAPTGNGGHGGKPFYGMLTIKYKITNPAAWDLKIKSTQFHLLGNQLDFAILNVRPKDVLEKHNYIHRKGYPWFHPRAYHHLLDGAIDDMDGPPALIDENGGSEEDKADHRDCSHITFDDWPLQLRASSGGDGRYSAFFIDPFTCTLGGGCPPGESC